MMTDQLPKIRMTARDEERRAQTRWDPESSVWQTVFSSEETPSDESELLVERIDRNLGIEKPTYRVVIGDVDIQLDEAGHPMLIELRAHPSNWLETSLPDQPCEATHVEAEFQVEFDLNHLAVFDVPAVVLCDPARARLAFRFKLNGGRTCAYRVADAVSFSEDRERRLCEIVFSDVSLPLNLTSSISKWTKPGGPE